MSPQMMPAAFLGHGSPMNTLEYNKYTAAWRRFGALCDKPRAVLMISAHWYINASAVTVMPQPRTIHDFYGFPPELHRFQYPAPGLPELAEEVADLAQPDRVGYDSDSWGLDHGAWSVLAHVFPEANVPVVQLSINALKSFDYHMVLGSRLAPLRERGVVIIGSGNLVHNLRQIMWHLPDDGVAWARDFDGAARALLQTSPESAADLQGYPDYLLAAPTPDHFIPLLTIAALAAQSGAKFETLVEGFAYGTISMVSLMLCRQAQAASDEDLPPGSAIPDPGVAPADQTNI